MPAFDAFTFDATFEGVPYVPATPSVEVVDNALDHIMDGLARLPQQFKDQPNVIAVLTCLITPMQALENAIAQVILQRSVLIATGVTLAMLGKLVGQPNTNSDVDDVYRRMILARIAANRSNGVPAALYRVARLVLNDITAEIVLRNEGPATTRLLVTTELSGVTAAVLSQMLNYAVDAGVRLLVQWSDKPPTSVFKLDSGPGLDQGYLAESTDNGVTS